MPRKCCRPAHDQASDHGRQQRGQRVPQAGVEIAGLARDVVRQGDARRGFRRGERPAEQHQAILRQHLPGAGVIGGRGIGGLAGDQRAAMFGIDHLGGDGVGHLGIGLEARRGDGENGAGRRQQPADAAVRLEAALHFDVRAENVGDGIAILAFRKPPHARKARGGDAGRRGFGRRCRDRAESERGQRQDKGEKSAAARHRPSRVRLCRPPAADNAIDPGPTQTPFATGFSRLSGSSSQKCNRFRRLAPQAADAAISRPAACSALRWSALTKLSA